MPVSEKEQARREALLDKKIYSEEDYKEFFGEPTRDDLERANCKVAGTLGHFQCGVCAKHCQPRFMCGCMKTSPSEGIKEQIITKIMDE